MRRTGNPHPDNIFGRSEILANRAEFARQRVKGVHHWGAKRPFRPRPGDRVLLRATSSSDLAVDKLRVATSADNWKTQDVYDFTAGDLIWDGLLWGWVREWNLLLPQQETGATLRYKIWAELPTPVNEEPQLLFADNQASFFEEAEEFAIYYGKDEAPAWARSARVYQIFVDRFNPGEGRSWMQTEHLDRPMGGTLRGITEKVEYIADMGFNCLWLTPIFASPSHHGYDTSDYFEVEPRFGTKDDLKILLEHAHKLGVHVLLDFVANHSSDQHSAMQAALAKPETPESAWFTWKRWPNYEAFFNVKSMPKLNLRFGSPARAHLLEAAKYWLEFGADGYRCDYANGPNLDFWVDFRRVCRETKPEAWLFGEVILPADEQRAFSGGLDGTLDFLACQAIRETIARKAWPVSKLAGVILQAGEYFTPEFSRPAFIDSHDMNRFYFTTQENPALLKIALTLLYLLPQPPIVYFGTETLLSQANSIHAKGAIGFDEARLPVNWSKPAVFAPLLKSLAELREAYPQLLEGNWACEQVDDKQGVLVLKRKMSTEQEWLFAVNLGDSPYQIELDTSSRLIGLPGKQGLELKNKRLKMDPDSCALLTQ